MDDFNTGNKKFSELMQKSRLSITNESFEDQLMQKIEAESQAIASISKNRKISLLFFILGVFLGLIINFSIPKMGNSILGGNINTAEFAIYFQVGFIVFILFYLETLYRSGVLKFRRKAI